MISTADPSAESRRRGPKKGTPRAPRMRREDRERQLLDVAETVFAEHGGGGSRVAAPIAQAIYAKYFGIDHGKSPAP